MEQGEASYDIIGKLADNRMLFLHDHIGDDIASDIVATLMYLDLQNSDTITLYINSESGDVASIFMIYDIMQLLQSPIETVCIGSATNESILLLAAGTEGLRSATKNSMLGLSQLLHYDSRFSDLVSAEILLEKSKKDNKRFLMALSKHIKKPYKTILNDVERQKFLSPNEAIKYGVIDQVI